MEGSITRRLRFASHKKHFEKKKSLLCEVEDFFSKLIFVSCGSYTNNHRGDNSYTAIAGTTCGCWMTSCRIFTHAHIPYLGEQNLKLWNSECVCVRKYDFFIRSTWCAYFTLTTSCSYLDRPDEVPGGQRRGGEEGGRGGGGEEGGGRSKGKKRTILTFSTGRHRRRGEP